MGTKQVIAGLLVCLSVLLVLLIALIFALLPSEEVSAEEPPQKEVLPTIIDVSLGTTTRVDDFLIRVYGFEYRPYLGRGYESTFIGVKPFDYFLIVYAEITNTGKPQKPLPIRVFGTEEQQYSEPGDLELNADLFFNNRLQPDFMYKARLPYEVTYGDKYEVRLYLDDERYKRIKLIK